MKKFAYLDSAEILHITQYEAIARTHGGKGGIVETDFPAHGGYPVDEEGKAYILYSETEEKHDREIPEKLAELYRKLK